MWNKNFIEIHSKAIKIHSKGNQFHFQLTHMSYTCFSLSLFLVLLTTIETFSMHHMSAVYGSAYMSIEFMGNGNKCTMFEDTKVQTSETDQSVKTIFLSVMVFIFMIFFGICVVAVRRSHKIFENIAVGMQLQCLLTNGSLTQFKRSNRWFQADERRQNKVNNCSFQSSSLRLLIASERLRN